MASKEKEAIFAAIEASCKEKFDWTTEALYILTDDHEKARKLYDFLSESARKNCIYWILIAKTLGIQKDVTRLIATILWEARKECLFDPDFKAIFELNKKNFVF